VALDTSPWPREDERYDAWFIAGYHHTHAPIATEALRRGGYAVVEKPLATTWEQFAEIESLISHAAHGKLIMAFQRRYTPMNNWARQDLRVNPGDPVSYHCMVYEIPLPKRHWYNWPNSRSRLTSNGCHWIDHFLFLNGYPTVNDYKVYTAFNGDMFVIMEADNGASFSMVLTEQGSERLGVRDYVELRANGVTVRMIDQARYESESSLKRICSHRLNPTHAYARLYETASNIIMNHGRGDDLRSLESTRVTLLLEDALASKIASFSGCGTAPAEPTDEQSRSIDYYP
jgi:predicted dehydrogenase